MHFNFKLTLEYILQELTNKQITITVKIELKYFKLQRFKEQNMCKRQMQNSAFSTAL